MKVDIASDPEDNCSLTKDKVRVKVEDRVKVGGRVRVRFWVWLGSV